MKANNTAKFHIGLLSLKAGFLVCFQETKRLDLVIQKCEIGIIGFPVSTILMKSSLIFIPKNPFGFVRIHKGVEIITIFLSNDRQLMSWDSITWTLYTLLFFQSFSQPPSHSTPLIRDLFSLSRELSPLFQTECMHAHWKTKLQTLKVDGIAEQVR